MNGKIRLAFASVAACALSSAAMAITSLPLTSFDFSGQCTDCTGSGTATLTLIGYTANTPILPENFYSLTYTSNLISFTLDNVTRFGLPPFADGKLDTPRGFYNVTVQGVDTEEYFDTFQTFDDGRWTVTREAATFDFGTNGFWNPAAGSAAPEPASWAMFIGGFGLIGSALRRRQVSVRFA